MESGHLENGDIDATIRVDLGESADFQAVHVHVQADKPGSEIRLRKKRKINVSHTVLG